MEKLVCKGKGQGYEWGRKKKKKKQQISPLGLERDEKRDAGNCEGQGGSCSSTVTIQSNGFGRGL